VTQIRDGQGPRYTCLGTRRAGGEDLTRHRHDADAGPPAQPALEHEHTLGRGHHRHAGPNSPVVAITTPVAAARREETREPAP